jgi:hypothetical protein
MIPMNSRPSPLRHADPVAQGPRFVTAILALAFVCLGLPALGPGPAGDRGAACGPLPPFVLASRSAGFHWGAFIAFLVFFALLCLGWLAGRGPRRATRDTGFQAAGAPFPWWGWLGLGAGLAAWVLAWSRFKWFAVLQPYTFTLQWLSFVAVVNGLVLQRQGHCPLQREPLFILTLFFASVLFWWMFEYLNGFVHNWVYRDASYHRGPLEYVLSASLAFSTVIPGVYSTRQLLATSPAFRRLSLRGPPLRLPPAGGLYLVPLFLVSAAFFLLGLYPDFLYPVVWIGPFAAWVGLKGLAGIPLNMGNLERGDWSEILGWALAALICGFFWEMWNFYSLSKWTYRVPYLQGFKVFEMPLAGFSGYLAFGLECALAVEIAAKIFRGRGREPCPQ